MSKNKQENYLDELLNSVSGEKTQEELEMLSLKSQLERMRNGKDDAFSPAFSEEDFLREFEEELDNEDYGDSIADLEKELGVSGTERTPKAAGNSEPELEPVMQDADTDLFVNTLDSEPLAEDEALPDLSSLSPMEEESTAMDSDDLMKDDLGEFGEIVGELNGELNDMESPAVALTEDGEVDLSGNSGTDLMDLISGEDGLSDLGDLLSGEGELEEEDTIGDFAEQEMKEQERAQSAEEETQEGKKARKKKKEKKKKDTEGENTGFFAKLAKMFFGEDEEEKEEDIIVGLNAGSSASELSDENERIMKEVDNEGKKGKKDKKKKEKAKKEKPKKEKPKKEKPKKEKPKKEKKPKPVDNTPPLPKVPVILIFLMVGSMAALVFLGTNLSSYQTNLKNAKDYYRIGDYPSGLRQMKGHSIKADDEQFYNKLSLLAAVSSEISNYDVFMAGDKPRYEMALDSLVCAAGRCNVNELSAREYECTDELDALKDKINTLLKENFKMNYDDALDIYSIGDREEYSRRLLNKLQDLGLISE